MRGWLLVRVVIAVLAAVAGWLLGILPLLPTDWQPRAPLVALGIVLVVYLASEYSHGIAGRKETQAYRNHVRDLQNFADHAKAIVDRQPQGITEPIKLDPPLGIAFRQHFGRVTNQIDEWNEIATRYRKAAERLYEMTGAERDKLNLGGSSGFPGILHAIVHRAINLADLTWQAQQNQIIAGAGSYWQVGPMPASESETERLLLDLWESCVSIRKEPKVVEWVNLQKRSQELWRPLRDELAAVAVTHDPPGRCRLCPK